METDQLTLQDLRRAVDALKRQAIKLNKIETQEEADALNAWERGIGLAGNWKIGDPYYFVPHHTNLKL